MITEQDVFLIKHTCQQFLAESKGIPLLKNLPTDYGTIKKVKVRHKQQNEVGKIFNEAFDEQIFERAVFCNGPLSFAPILDERVSEYDIYYVLPPDGYKYLHNPAVHSVINDHIGGLDPETLIELFKFSYNNTDLVEALDSTAQIIVYNIPHFYCIKANSIDYNDLVKMLS